MKKLIVAALMIVALQGCAVVSTAYSAATSVVTQYCSMSDTERAFTQLVVAGKTYDSGICDAINSDATLAETLKVAADATATIVAADTVAEAKAAVAAEDSTSTSSSTETSTSD